MKNIESLDRFEKKKNQKKNTGGNALPLNLSDHYFLLSIQYHLQLQVKDHKWTMKQQQQQNQSSDFGLFCK